MKNKSKFTAVTTHFDYLDILESIHLDFMAAIEARIGSQHSFYTSKNF